MNRPFWLIITVYFSLVGCSMKAPDDSFHILITSNPPDANITVCNESTGLCVSNVKTPCKMVLSRTQDTSWPTRYTILCTKEGFDDVARTLHFGVDGWYLLIIDKATSETLEVRDVNGYKIELELPVSETIDLPPADKLVKMNLAWWKKFRKFG